jgi:hypothetical protein
MQGFGRHCMSIIWNHAHLQRQSYVNRCDVVWDLNPALIPSLLKVNNNSRAAKKRDTDAKTGILDRRNSIPSCEHIDQGLHLVILCK